MSLLEPALCYEHTRLTHVILSPCGIFWGERQVEHHAFALVEERQGMVKISRVECFTRSNDQWLEGVTRQAGGQEVARHT